MSGPRRPSQQWEPTPGGCAGGARRGRASGGSARRYRLTGPLTIRPWATGAESRSCLKVSAYWRRARLRKTRSSMTVSSSVGGASGSRQHGGFVRPAVGTGTPASRYRAEYTSAAASPSSCGPTSNTQASSPENATTTRSLSRKCFTQRLGRGTAPSAGSPKTCNLPGPEPARIARTLGGWLRGGRRSGDLRAASI